MNKIRFGIAGPGNIARKFAAAAKNLPAEVELIAVASRTLDKAQEFAATYEIPNAFGSYEEMAASPLVDCVYVATPHPFHKPVAEIFLRAGKHVICEKPLCVNAREAKELADCAKEHGVFLMEAMWTTFLPAVRELLATIERGEIGDILGLTADFCYSSSPAEENLPEIDGINITAAMAMTRKIVVPINTLFLKKLFSSNLSTVANCFIFAPPHILSFAYSTKISFSDGS